jgi:CYTH domain-containing protein
MEIERKFLLERIPDGLDLGSGTLIEQGYLFTEPAELRLRRRGEQFRLTVKTSGTEAREEWESEIPEWVWQALWTHTEGKRVTKTRYVIERDGHALELDVYHGDLERLIILECEFESLEAAQAFGLPREFADAVDVTEDKHYKNKTLAVRGRPHSQ